MSIQSNLHESKFFIAPLCPLKPLKNSQIISISLTQQEKYQNVHKIIQFYQKGGILPKDIAINLIQNGNHIIKQQPNLLYLADPINIIGDIHGQFFDLTTIMSLLNIANSQMHGQTTLFLGDYVDRGHFSIEVMMILLLIKIYWPKQVYLLRGNHQSRNQTIVYNFKTQCTKKYNQQIYEMFMELFDCLPLAAIVNNSFFCVHAGISTELKSIEDINKLDRFKQIPISGLFCDLMWSDPTSRSNGQLPHDQLAKFNTNRCCSINYGYKLLNQIYKRNHLVCMIRAHQVQLQGYKFHHWHGKTALPTLITIFSAPEYGGSKNKGAFLKIKENKIQILQQLRNKFEPYVMPNFIDAFQISIPIMCAQVSRIFWFLIDQKPLRKKTQQDLLNCSQLTSEGQQVFDKSIQRQIQKKRIFLYKQYAHFKSYIDENISFIEKDNIEEITSKLKE